MSANNSQRAVAAPELYATMTGVSVIIGKFLYPPVHVVFDNLSTVAVVIYVDGVQWKTFAAGSALVLDMRGNHGLAPNFTFNRGTSISGIGASGDFSIAYTYAQE